MNIPQNTPATEILEALDQWGACAPSSERNTLWWVLTALRGPDSEDRALKLTTTAVIRAHSLPKFADRMGADVADKTRPVSIAVGTTHDHFNFHIALATEMLGLEIE